MYTALSLGIQLKRDTPKEVIDILQFMIDGPRDEQIPEEAYDTASILQFVPPTPNHEFFSCSRWVMLLRCSSYCVDWQTRWELLKDPLFKYEPRYYLTGVSNLKNYDDEIEKFLSWIQPYLETYGFIGWKMYEGAYNPTIIYNNDNLISYKPVRSDILNEN